MGSRYRKSVKAGPLRVNLSKSGVGYSVGTKGLRYTKKAGGGTRTTAIIPGTGISYVKDTGKQKHGSVTNQYAREVSATSGGNANQRKVARILGLIFAVLTFLLAIVLLLCGEFVLSALLCAIGALFIFIAKSTKQPIAQAGQEIAQEHADSTVENVRFAQSDIPNTKDAMPTSEEKTYRVAGTTFYSDNIICLASENPDYDFSKKELIDEGRIEERVWQYEFYPVHIELVPEPENPKDPSAIKVIVDGEHIGYIKAGSCSHVRKLINENRILDISCEMGGGPYKYIREEYDEDKDKNVYVLEQNEANFFAALSIRESRE